MGISHILFDLDGTLLPMEQDKFVKAYFGSLARKLAPFGYNPEELIKAIWSGTKSMVLNNGEKYNEERFWDTFCKIFGDKAKNDMPHFDEFYEQDFDKVSVSCGYTPKAKETVELVKALGCKVVLATNPIFPSVATECRMKWAGLDKSDFEYYTVYENSKYCKPNLDYYREILAKLSLNPEECVMVGNDVSEDMIASELGMKVFLLTDCLINKENVDISMYPNGNFDDLQGYLKEILS